MPQLRALLRDLLLRVIRCFIDSVINTYIALQLIDADVLCRYATPLLWFIFRLLLVDCQQPLRDFHHHYARIYLRITINMLPLMPAIMRRVC